MKLKCVFIILIFAFKSFQVLAQTEQKRSIVFYPMFGNSILTPNNLFYTLSKGDSIQIEAFKFYISAIELLKDDKIVWKEENSFHLIDFADDKSLTIVIAGASNIIYNTIRFNLGIDSLTNVSGAMGGDLDPTKGMYWTWQSGYVNLKLEGRSNVCKSRNNAFQFHLGGYQYPFNALQKLILKVEENKKVDIVLDIKNFIESIDLSQQNQIMSPSKQAVSLSEKAVEIFRVE